ncbi:hypothetical protein WAF17_16340 [Bernardetia sp. ABR2-2B]|uniref:hypothetical protein n=1 Tax=Bernardetia sp. ABR2-2B TaxID=3127472 RepID=UPI0030CCFFDD
METIFVKIAPHSNQFWDPTNKKQKMLVGREIFEVQDTAEIQKGIANKALLKSSKEEFDKQDGESKTDSSKEESKKITQGKPSPKTRTTKK